jgi:hypothetical protein
MGLNELSKAVGVPLNIRDTQKLIDETVEHLNKQARRKQVVRVKNEELKQLNEAEAIDKFYEKGNKVD